MLKDLENKKMALLGLGIENFALAKFLIKKKLRSQITICDFRNETQLGDKFKKLKNSVSWKLGFDFNKNLDEFDIMFRSPGWPILCPGIQAAIKKQTKLSSPMNLFFELSPAKNIIGITGTKGKGTTSSLIYEIIKESKNKAWLGGNIGFAPFDFMDKIKKNDWVVLELSSFQLEDLNHSPHIAIITNFFKEHLSPADPNNPNYHKSLKIYWQAKSNIFNHQTKNDYLIVNKKIKLKFKKAETKNKIIFFEKSQLPSKLAGEHNKENIAAAVEAAKIIGIKKETIKKAVANFEAPEHRLEFVKKISGVKFYNDTFATTPESTIIALKSFKEPIILIAGGADKGADFSSLAKEIKKCVKFCALLDGDATPRIKKELVTKKYPQEQTRVCFSIKEAFEIAKKKSKPGDIVLLSPACASFGMFKNYKERGEKFKNLVNKNR